VRAGTDITTSLLVGATLVMLLVWLANLLRMPAAEVAVVRGALHRAGELIDLPWWLWAALYALLAGASLAFARWPVKLARATRWFTRLRVAPAANLTRRVLGGAHIGLLVIALIGLTTPPTVGPVLRAAGGPRPGSSGPPAPNWIWLAGSASCRGTRSGSSRRRCWTGPRRPPPGRPDSTRPSGTPRT